MTDEDLLEAALSRAALLLPDDPDRITRLRRARAARRRQRRGSLGLVAMIVIAAVGTGLVIDGHRHTPGSSASVTASPLSVGRLGASGLVVAVPGHAVRFCDSDVFVDDVGHAPGYVAPPPSGRCVGVDVVGVDLAKLSHRVLQDGEISGQAELQGTYAGGVLHVDHQGPPVTETFTPRAYDHPPCATPAGGWALEPTSPDFGNPDVTVAQSYAGHHAGVVEQVAILRPSARQALVYVLTNVAPTAARAALSADYPADQLCVSRSAYTSKQVASAAADPALQVGPEISSTGAGIDPLTAQPDYEVGIVVETPAIRAGVTRHPKGLVRVTAWLAPVTP